MKKAKCVTCKHHLTPFQQPPCNTCHECSNYVGDLKRVDTPVETDSSQVVHPKHYNHGKYEAIDVIHDWDLGFNLGNALKYICRAGHKVNAVEDLEKAVFYLQDAIKRITEKECE